MVGTHPVKHSFSKSWDTRSHFCFQTVWSNPPTHSFSNDRDTSGYTVVFKTLGQPYSFVFIYLGHTQLHTCFQIVDTHPVTHSISNGWDTCGYTLVFEWSVYIRLYTRFQKVRTTGYTFVLKRFGHTRIHTRFQMIGTHSVTHSFSYVLVTAGYPLVSNSSGHT